MLTAKTEIILDNTTKNSWVCEKTSFQCHDKDYNYQYPINNGSDIKPEYKCISRINTGLYSDNETYYNDLLEKRAGAVSQ